MGPGSRRYATRAIIVTALAACCAAQPAAAEKYALLIGVSRYHTAALSGGIAALDYARADAEALEGLLRNGSQYKIVRTLTDRHADRTGILSELNYFRRELKPEDSFLLYFAGHGARDPSSGKTYWLTYDTDLVIMEDNGIRLEYLLDYVREIKARERLVLLDHCFSGDLAYATTDAAEARSSGVPKPSITRGVLLNEEFKSQLQGGSGIIVLAASRDLAYESKTLGHGFFTEAVIRSLGTREADGSDGDGLLKPLELIQFVGQELPKLAGDAQQLVTLQDGVVNLQQWSPVLRLPPGTHEAVGLWEHYLEVLRAWDEANWITPLNFLKCKDALDKWLAVRQQESATGGSAGNPPPGFNPAEQIIVQQIQRYVESADRDPASAKGLAQLFETSIAKIKP